MNANKGLEQRIIESGETSLANPILVEMQQVPIFVLKFFYIMKIEKLYYQVYNFIFSWSVFELMEKDGMKWSRMVSRLFDLKKEKKKKQWNGVMFVWFKKKRKEKNEIECDIIYSI